MSLGKRLKEQREKRNWSQIYVANKIGITNAVLSNYERDIRDPDTDTLKKLANLYEVSTDYLLDRTDTPKNNKINSLDEINNILSGLKIDDVFFHDIEAWKNFTEEDIAELKKHFEWVAHKAKERSEKLGKDE